MSRFKVRKQMAKLSMIQACQGTETFEIVFMVVIIHATKIYAYAKNNKSNLHLLYFNIDNKMKAYKK